MDLFRCQVSKQIININYFLQVATSTTTDNDRPLGSLQHIIFCYWDVALMVENTTWQEGAHAGVAKLELLIEHLSKDNDHEEVSEVVYHKAPYSWKVIYRFQVSSRVSKQARDSCKWKTPIHMGHIFQMCSNTFLCYTKNMDNMYLYIHINTCTHNTLTLEPWSTDPETSWPHTTIVWCSSYWTETLTTHIFPNLRGFKAACGATFGLSGWEVMTIQTTYGDTWRWVVG